MKAPEVWAVQMKKAPFDEWAAQFSIDPVIARVIRNRGMMSRGQVDWYLNAGLDQLYSPHLLSGMDKAVELLSEDIRAGRRIRVIGDYDIDGICACYILIRGLLRLGARVACDIPERMKDGYGLNMRLIEEAAEKNTDTILTCDNGIAAVSQIAYAKSLGMRVVVTDHHEPQYQMKDEEKEWLLPEADVLIDPKLPEDSYPFDGICGAVVAWKLIGAMYEKWRVPKGEWLEFLPFAAFATIGDVMDLCDENRIIVKYGLRALKETSNPGMRALISQNALSGKDISVYHVGFVLGPCMNAGGRLSTARESLALLLETDQEKARELAEDLTALNQERKLLTTQALEEASALLEGQPEDGLAAPRREDPVYVIYLKDCHESIAGIVAGKIREQWGHPCFVLTEAQEEGMIKGSGRSIPAYPMFDELVRCAELLEAYGGHAMAAGLTLKRENLEALRERLCQSCALKEEDFRKKVLIDAAMPISYISERLISQLKLLEPCGKGNEKPVFAQQNLKLYSARILGKNQNVLKMKVSGDESMLMDALYFGDPYELLGYLEGKYSAEKVRRLLQGRGSGMSLSVIYDPDINEYQGVRTLQIIIRSFR